MLIHFVRFTTQLPEEEEVVAWSDVGFAWCRRARTPV
jgi:hypothetical protein